MNESEIKAAIEAGIPGCQVDISGDGRHFEATISSASFAGKTTIQCHREVYATLGDSFQTDAVHALSLRTVVPDAK